MHNAKSPDFKWLASRSPLTNHATTTRCWAHGLIYPLRLLILSLVTALTLAGANAQTLRKVALVIGNGNYASVQKLPNPPHDAELLASKLKALGFTLIGDSAQNNLKLSQFNSELQQFSASAHTADVAIFYYAGHGLQANGINYLVPVDANPIHGMSDVPMQMVDASTVLDTLDKANIKLKIMILDACRNNPFVSRGLSADTNGLADMSRGLTAMAAPEGTAIWYATQPGDVAQDGAGNNGPFALAISHSILVPGLDIFGVFNKTGLEVMGATNPKQVPWLAATPLDPPFYFIQNEGGGTRSVFVPNEQPTSPVDRVRQIFSTGLKAPTRNFVFGQNYKEVNKELDNPFGIGSWESLPKAAEYNPREVRYFWVPLKNLPVALSTLVTPGNMKGHCVDPESYIAFFFEKERLFHISVRFYKGQTCSSYGWLLNGLFSPDHRAALLHNDEGDTVVSVSDSSQWSIIEITRKSDSIWTD
jgi:hypothetical protein